MADPNTKQAIHQHMMEETVPPAVLESREIECVHLRALLLQKCDELNIFSDPTLMASVWPDSVPCVEPANLSHQQLLVVLAALLEEESPAVPPKRPRLQKAVPSGKRGADPLGFQRPVAQAMIAPTMPYTIAPAPGLLVFPSSNLQSSTLNIVGAGILRPEPTEPLTPSSSDEPSDDDDGG